MINTKAFDLNLFRVFVYIYISRNLTRVAEKLNITQPAVSRSLNKLNELYGEKLFVRQNNEMVPSRLAEHISDSIFNTLEQADMALRFGSDFNVNSQQLDIKLGMNDYCVNVLFPYLYTSFSKLGDNVTLHSTHCTYANVLDKIEAMTIDGAIISEAPKSKRVESVPLFTDDYVVICSTRDQPDLDLTKSSLHALFPLQTFLDKSHALVSYDGSSQGWVDEKLLEKGLRRNVVCTTHLFASIPQIVVELDLLATLPRKIAMSLAKHYPIAIYELPFENKTHHFHFIRPRYSIDASYSQIILNTVLDAIESI